MSNDCIYCIPVQWPTTSASSVGMSPWPTAPQQRSDGELPGRMQQRSDGERRRPPGGAPPAVTAAASASASAAEAQRRRPPAAGGKGPDASAAAAAAAAAFVPASSGRTMRNARPPLSPPPALLTRSASGKEIDRSPFEFASLPIGRCATPRGPSGHAYPPPLFLHHFPLSCNLT